MQKKYIRGTINLPGDKSISHRVLMLSSLSSGECVINNLSTGLDVEATRNCLGLCGVSSIDSDGIVKIIGGGLKKPRNVLDCGNSGTTVRLLLGLLAGQGISANFIGDKSLSSRPMKRILLPLSKMGVKFDAVDGRLPISLNVNGIVGINYKSEIASAQVKSAILLAGLGANSRTIYSEHYKTRDHTEIMLSELGADIEINRNIMINKMVELFQPFEYNVPGDPSSAAFFAALASLLINSDIKIKNILANSTRIGFFKVLEKMGAGIEWGNVRKEFGEYVGDVHIYYKPLNGINITQEMVPSIIDELPILAVLASQADSPTIISGAEELRVKETDRIKAICYNLKNMGCDVIEKRDGLIINPGNCLYNTHIKTFGDHRIAMAFTIAGYITQKRNVIDDSNCINISFPEFNKILQSLLL